MRSTDKVWKQCVRAFDAAGESASVIDTNLVVLEQICVSFNQEHQVLT